MNKLKDKTESNKSIINNEIALDSRLYFKKDPVNLLRDALV